MVKGPLVMSSCSIGDGKSHNHFGKLTQGGAPVQNRKVVSLKKNITEIYGGYIMIHHDIYI